MKFLFVEPRFEVLAVPPRPNIKAAKIADFPDPLAPDKKLILLVGLYVNWAWHIKFFILKEQVLPQVQSIGTTIRTGDLKIETLLRPAVGVPKFEGGPPDPFPGCWAQINGGAEAFTTKPSAKMQEKPATLSEFRNWILLSYMSEQLDGIQA